MDIPGAGSTGRGIGPGCRTGAAADQGRQPVRHGLIDDLRTNEMDVGIDPAGSPSDGQ